MIALLNELSADEWNLPTLSSKRRVKDIASHLLDGSLRRLSIQRDNYQPSAGGGQPNADESLLEFLNRLNAEWEVATRQLSPRVLIDLLERTDPQVAELFAALDPFALAIFPVARAGESQSLNWMDIAREYTEKRHHMQQIFDATGRASTIVEKRLFQPCLETFMRALPFTFRDVDAAEGTTVCVEILGAAGCEWWIAQSGVTWSWIESPNEAATAYFSIDQDSAWKLFTKRIDRATAFERFPDIKIEGDQLLAGRVAEMVSVMA